MGEFLVTLGGVSPSCDGLSQIMHSYDDERRRIVSMRKLRSSREFSEILMRFYIGGTANVSDLESTDLEEAVAVAIVGGPLAPKDFALFDLIAGAGGKVVLDGTENGERTLPGTFDPARTRRNPVDELVRAYFDTIPDIFRRPNDGFYVWICRETQQRHVKGVIFLRHVWCDLWQAELHRLRSSLPLPVLDLECDGGIVSDRWGARVDAFIESLR
jgi:benzoyl-CoA reductase/2-hydroxyglutaryl-CoA dehydratase subunit BcrC/BadD/HgdB